MNLINIVEILKSSTNPVILVDTCSLIDMLRISSRYTGKYFDNELLSWDLISEKIESNEITLIITDLVSKEYQKHEDDYLKEFNQWLKSVQDNFKKLFLLHGKLIKLPITDSQIDYMFNRIKDKTQAVIKNALYLDHDDNSFMQGSYRNIRGDAPSSAGKEHADCIIYQHYLNFVTELRSKGSQSNILYFTRNTNDYCKAKGSLELAPPLDTEFATLNMKLVTKWSSCVYALFPNGLNGQVGFLKDAYLNWLNNLN